MNHNGCQRGKRIRQLREGRDWSVTELAGRVRITPQSLSNIELGNKPAGVATLIAIARELDVPLDEIVIKDSDADEDEAVGAAA